MISKLGKLLGFGKGDSSAVDPVCEMTVDTADPPGCSSKHKGITYYFCAPGCKHAFDEEPDRYLQSTP
jgi:YHS domain-containing protein